MIDIYLSPSTQEKNQCVMGDFEEQHINQICDLMIPYLVASDITWRRNIPAMNHISSMQDSNAIGVKMHYAIHSNASNGKARGDHVFYKPFSTEGKFAATLLMEAEKTIYPLPELCKIKLPLILYTEIYSTKASITIIDEMFFHDNPEDAAWGHANMAALAKCKAQALCKILGKVFVDPAKPIPSRAHTAPAFNGNVLRLYSQGSWVKAVQQRLDALGFDCGKADSDFGKLTRAAVIKFQKSRKITADGLVGKITWSALFN